MILIQILLAIALIGILFRFLSTPNTSQTRAWKKILLLLLTVFALIAIFFPNVTNNLAHFLGVGRGADLLLYILTIAFVFQQLNHYIKQKEEQQRIVKLARKIALMEATLDAKNTRK